MTEGGDGKKVCLGLIPNSHGTEAKKRFESDILDFFCYPYFQGFRQQQRREHIQGGAERGNDEVVQKYFPVKICYFFKKMFECVCVCQIQVRRHFYRGGVRGDVLGRRQKRGRVH